MDELNCDEKDRYERGVVVTAAICKTQVARLKRQIQFPRQQLLHNKRYLTCSCFPSERIMAI